MDKKYISESRYKKTTRNKANLEKTGKKLKKTKKKINKKVLSIIIGIIIVCVFIIGVKKCIYKYNDKKNMIIGTDGTLKPINNTNITIGINNQDLISPINTKNIYVAELNKFIYLFFIKVKDNYQISYEAVKNIEKVSNTEYIISVNSKCTYDAQKNISIHDLKNSIEQLINLDDDTIYKNNVKNINNLEVLDNDRLKIFLKKEDPLFIYNLEIPVLPISKYNNIDKIKEDLAPQELGSIYNVYQNAESIIYERGDSSSKAYPERINILKCKESDELIQNYKDKKIDAFFSTRQNIQNDLGKYEYNIKQIPTGQCVFIFGNPSSQNYKDKEARVALSYLINKQYIKKEVYKNMASPIDIPYLNYNTKYRYDKIAAQNTLNSSGYEKIGGIYTKNNVSLTFKLLVNTRDEKLYQIAKIIKNDMAEVGIRIELIEVDNSSYGTFLNNGSYDLAIMNVNLNNSIDISFLNRFILETEKMKNNLENINNSNPSNIESCFKEKLKILQEEALCIGVVAEITNFIYSKNINGFDDIKYMNVFNKIQDIGLTKK